MQRRLGPAWSQACSENAGHQARGPTLITSYRGMASRHGVSSFPPRIKSDREIIFPALQGQFNNAIYYAHAAHRYANQLTMMNII